MTRFTKIYVKTNSNSLRNDLFTSFSESNWLKGSQCIDHSRISPEHGTTTQTEVSLRGREFRDQEVCVFRSQTYKFKYVVHLCLRHKQKRVKMDETESLEELRLGQGTYK